MKLYLRFQYLDPNLIVKYNSYFNLFLFNSFHFCSNFSILISHYLIRFAFDGKGIKDFFPFKDGH
jgi:hypothetical protein